MIRVASTTTGVLFLLAGISSFIPDNPVIGSGAFFPTDIFLSVSLILIGLIALLASLYSHIIMGVTFVVLAALLLAVSITGFVLSPDEMKFLGLTEISYTSSWLLFFLGALCAGVSIYTLVHGE